MATLDRLAPPISTPSASAWSPRRAIVAAVFLAVAIALLQVIQTSSFAHTGQTLQQLETQKASLSAQTKNLEAEVAALSSLDRIDRTARDSLGMVPARNIEYLNVALEAPQGALLPRPLLTASTAEAVQKSQPWWRTLLSALPLP